MERGYINIKDDECGHYTVEAKLVNGTLWLTEWEIARLFNTVTVSIRNSFRAIFNSGLLYENKVTMELTSSKSSCKLYNLEALIFVSFRVHSLEARAFREWVFKALSEYAKNDTKRNVIITYSMDKKSSNFLYN
jgi:Virulence protein